MQSSMTLSSMVALFSAMVILAAIPSLSVLAVSARSAMGGFVHGLFTTIGIVLGDITFIVLAIWGLSFLSETMGEFLGWIKYVGGAYLMILGVELWRSNSPALEVGQVAESSLLSSLLTGLLITLGDQKATLFYLGFLPAFLDLSRITYGDTLVIVAITIVAVGGVKLGYALLADRARWLMNARVRTGMNRLAGAVLIAVGIVLVTQA
ncbi:MAG: LysE family translocator [Elainella sp. Prado103]|nr:LysE family translocator [Elainella sp. Prado103]